MAIVIPLRGVSMLDSDGGRFWGLEADRACYDAIKKNLRKDIPVHELDLNINDPELADTVASILLGMLRQ